MTQLHVKPPPTPPMKGKYDGKSDKDVLKLKLRRDTTSSTSDFYGFNMSLFDNGEQEEILLFVRNFNTTLVMSGMLETGAKFQYLRTIVHGEDLCRFDSFSDDVESTEPLTVEYIIKRLALYPSPEIFIFKKPAMRCGTMKPCGLKVRFYADCFIELNKFLALLTGATLSDKIGVNELIFLKQYS